MLNKLAAFVFIASGSAGVIASTYWGLQDYSALITTNQKLQASAFNSSERQFQLLIHRENTHRINVGFEGCWIGLSGILMATGYIVGKK